MKGKKLWKRNGVLAAVVLLICVAAYLNWSYAKSGGDTVEAMESESLWEESSTRTLGDAVLVSSEEETGDSYFAAARLSRSQARDEALAILQETVDDDLATEEARALAAESITVMATCSMAESEIESLAAAKGYESCVAYVSDESASLVVGTGEGGLTDTDVAILTDIVRDETGLSAGQIKVIETEG